MWVVMVTRHRLWSIIQHQFIIASLFITDQRHAITAMRQQSYRLAIKIMAAIIIVGTMAAIMAGIMGADIIITTMVDMTVVAAITTVTAKASILNVQ
jgi:hypothetical protein